MIATMVYYAICKEQLFGIHLLRSRKSTAHDRPLKLKVSTMSAMIIHQKEVLFFLINTEQPYAICVASVKLKALKKKLENDDAHGPDVEALWYLSLKVKEKSTTPPPPASTTDDSEPDRNLMHLIRVTAPVEVMYLTKKHSAPSMAKANQIDYMYTN